ncbi:MAG: hypothetical protein JW862_13775, partial [Anaerolineales bacterium]|nr:hypothetical protein [Anaerolineales bacterium]
AALMLALAALLGGVSGEAGATAAAEAVETTSTNLPLLQYLPLLLAGLSLLAALYFAIHGLTWQVLRDDRAFSLIVLQMLLILPQLAPFPVSLAGWDPTDYSSAGMVRTGIFVVLLAAISLVIGLLWNRQLFLINAAIFYIPFTVFYTSIFTNGQGFFTGLVGSLGYWVKQQAVQRGSQPWYYYLLVQIPVYEFLPALGLILAGYYGLRLRPELVRTRPDNQLEQGDPNLLNSKGEWLFVLLTIFWSLSSLLAYSYAGEKMPWLTVHITLAMILASGWALGKVVERIDWPHVRQQRGWLLIILLLVCLLALATSTGSLLGDNPPFQGKELQQLNATSTFLTALLTALASGYGVYRLLKDWQFEQVVRLGLLVVFSLLGVLTVRAAIRAAYINYDYPTEYLVYAHSAHGVKEALAQIEELSYRTTDGLDIVVAYDNETTYPFWWYLRDYPNQKFYAANPTRELRDAPVILVGAPNYARIEPVVGQAYYQFDYKRIWWPNQDYYNLTWARLARVFTDRQLAAALWDIWYDRDYSAYAAWANKNDLTLPNWQPSQDMRLYVRKDIAAQVWNMGASPAVGEALLADPYEGKQLSLMADRSLGGPGNAPGQLQTPRNAAVAPDGTIYVADTNNHRIQHLSPDGQVLHTWGSFADGLSMENGAPSGSFYEPWSLAIAPDGSVFVADTWNHRIQKFSADGTFIAQWGVFGQAETGSAFWGPRDIAIGPQGRVYVTDTGNKRIAVFDQDGNFITQFGEAGLLPGQLDEPVGLAVDAAGRVYVADTWNQRIQVFQPDASGLIYTPVLEWPIVGWYGQSLDNKPYLAVAGERLYVSDPEGYRILAFDLQGQFLFYWGDYGSDLGTFILPTGLAADGTGGLWVVDTGNQRLVHFNPPISLPEPVQESEQPVQELQLDEP